MEIEQKELKFQDSKKLFNPFSNKSWGQAATVTTFWVMKIKALSRFSNLIASTIVKSVLKTLRAIKKIR
jgi:hypothetical protein